MSSYKKLLSNTFMMTIGQFSSKLLSFLLVPLYTSVLSTAEYGAFDLLVTTVSLLSPLLTLVASEAVMRFCLDQDYQKSHILTIGMLLSMVGTVVLLAAYPLIMTIETLATNYWWLLAFFVLTNMQSVLMQYLKGTESIRMYTVCGVINTAVNLMLNAVFLLVFQWGIVGYMLANCIANALTIGIVTIWGKVWRNIVNPFKIPRSVYKSVFNYSAPMVPNSISWWISNSSDKYMIQWMVSAAAVGIYSVAYKIPSILTVFTTIFISSFQISSVEDFGTKKSKDFFNNTYKIYSAVNIIAAAVCISLSCVFAKILFQKAFFEAWKVSCLLILAYVFNTMSAFLGTIYTAAKRTQFLFFSTIIAAGLNIVLNALLIGPFGIYGAALATLVSYGVVWCLRLIHSRKILPIGCNVWRDLLSYCLLSVEAVLMICFDKMLNVYALLIMLVILAINTKEIMRTDVVKRLIGNKKERGKTCEFI